VPGKKEKLPLSVTHPELAKEAIGWDPSKFTMGSNSLVTWECLQGHQWRAVIDNRTRRGSGCPYCANKSVLIGFNDLQTTRPDIAAKADGWDTQSLTSGSERVREWKCSEGHSWSAKVHAVVSGTGCLVCLNKQILKGFNDLNSMFPEIASQADGWDPSLYGAGSHKKMPWICSKGHPYKATIVNRTRRGDRCSVCSSKTLLPGFNDLAATFPQIAAEADNWNPSAIFPNSNKKLPWECKLGHKWIATPNGRTYKNSGCPVCSGRTVQIGFNDLATKFPDLATEADGWDPRTIGIGSDLKRKWRCTEGHTWTAVVGSRTRGIGCPSCAKFGFDPSLDGFLYFLSHNDWMMFQIGITNFPKKRIASHKSLGWELLELRGPMEGFLAQQWETAILRMLNAKGADLSNERIAGKFDGYSEAWSKSTFEVVSIKALMRLTQEYEDSWNNQTYS
jgi:hypothetical protein